MNVLTNYQRTNRRRLILLSLMGMLTLAAMFGDILTGVADITLDDVFQGIFHPSLARSLVKNVLWLMRLPIAISAVVIGAALGLSGALMQTILGNPMASPYTLGIGAGAAFGASLAIITNATDALGALSLPTCAFFFAMAISLGIYTLGRIQGLSSNVMILSGIALLFLFQALQALLQYGASEGDVQAIVFWTFGNLQKSTWGKTGLILAAFCVCSPLIMADSWRYTALMLGDSKAESLGVEVDRLKLKGFIIVSALTAVSVCFVGTIGFIGLAAPHLSRFLIGEDQRFYLPMSALCGALLLSSASIICKSVIPGSIFPIGIITSLIGVPFFFAAAIRRKAWH